VQTVAPYDSVRVFPAAATMEDVVVGSAIRIVLK
jgi:hypothetical protein